MARSYQKAAVDEAAPDDDGLERYKRWYRQDVEKANKWRGGNSRENGGAKEDFKFRDGDQWSDDDKVELDDKDRPVIVFNRTGVLVDAVVGIEVGNRREVRYIPRELNDSKPNEVLSSAAEWFRDLCDAEDEESEAFKDTVTAGMGWTETRIDRKENPDGEPKVERVDPFEMVWDCNAQKANLVDRKRNWRVRKMDIADAMKLFPNADENDLNAAWAINDTENTDKPHNNDKDQLYTHEVDGKNGVSRNVTVVQCQFIEETPYYKALIMTPDGQPQEVELDEAKFKIAQKQGAVIQSAKLSHETVMQAFLGRTILKKPMPTQTGLFTFNCMTGLKDEIEGVYYGIVRRAKDPQRWANKWLSQMMHIMNSNAKGGIMAEKGVADNQREFEDSWAKTDAITWIKNGQLAAGKIEPKPVAQFPAGFAQLMHYADEMIIKATGISMELLGIREVNQPGVLEYQRKQAGMGILATFFDSKKRYTKIQGRLMLKLIQDHLSDGRLIRIVGDDLAQYVPLMKKEGIAKAKAEALQQAMQQGQQMVQQAMLQAPQMAQEAIQQGMPPEEVAKKGQEMLAQLAEQGKAAVEQITAKFDAMKPVEGEYDIIVDDAPSAPNDKEKNWQIIQSMLPMFKDQIGPEQAMILFKYSPLPTSFGEDIKKSIEEASQRPPSPQEQAMQEMQKMQLANEQAKLANEAAKIEVEKQKIAADVQIAQLDQMNEIEKNKTERQKIDADQTKAIADIETAQAPVREASAKGNDQMAEAMKMFAQAMAMMNAPKRRTPIRDPQTNRIVDVVEQPMQ